MPERALPPLRCTAPSAFILQLASPAMRVQRAPIALSFPRRNSSSSAAQNAEAPAPKLLSRRKRNTKAPAALPTAPANLAAVADIDLSSTPSAAQTPSAAPLTRRTVRHSASALTQPLPSGLPPQDAADAGTPIESRVDFPRAEDREKRFYFLGNFWRLVETVEAAYGTLFLPEERAYLTKLRILPEAPLRLFVRLLGRAGPWFRLVDLENRYAHEVGHLDDALRALASEGLAISATVADLAQPEGLHGVLDTMRREEINAVLIAMQCGAKSSARKADLVERLLAVATDSTQRELVLARVLEASGPLTALHGGVRAFCERVFRLFYLADGLDHTELFKLEANIVRFVRYPLSGIGSLFPTRTHLIAWEECRAWQHRLEGAIRSFRDGGDTAADDACMTILHDAAYWLTCASSDAHDPFRAGAIEAPRGLSLTDEVRAVTGAKRSLSEALERSRVTYDGTRCCYLHTNRAVERAKSRPMR